MTGQPVLPYGGQDDANSGWSGSDTSERRARRADEGEVTARRQQQVLHQLQRAGHYGLTYWQIGDATRMDHGQVTSPLTALHIAGLVARLVETRTRPDRPNGNPCHVYVLPEYVDGRPTERPVRNKVRQLLDDFAEFIREGVPDGCPHHRAADPDDGCRWCRGAGLVAHYDNLGH